MTETGKPFVRCARYYNSTKFAKNDQLERNPSLAVGSLPIQRDTYAGRGERYHGVGRQTQAALDTDR